MLRNFALAALNLPSRPTNKNHKLPEQFEPDEEDGGY
jgi:hypothetical protein